MSMKTNLIQILIMCSSVVACSTEYSAVYQSVNAESKWDEANWITVTDSSTELPLYRVENNKLYLMIRGTNADRLFRTVISYPSWDEAEINSLLEQQADIRKLIPADWNNWLPKGYGDECKGQSNNKV